MDRPEHLHVRQKLLEGALQYYRRFIDQQEADPSVRAALSASSARVAQILSALSAQQDYLQFMMRTMLLEEPPVRKDLRLSERQTEKIEQLSEQLKYEMHEAFRVSFALSEQAREKKFKEMAAVNEKAVAALLTAEQSRRLKQIALQQRGPQAFVEPEVVEALHLTAKQKARIRPLVDRAHRLLREADRPGEHGPEVDLKSDQIAKDAEESILAELTSSQQAAWKELIGERLSGRLRFAFQSSLGPPDHPPPHGPGHRPGDGPPDLDDGPPGRAPGPPPDGPRGRRPPPPDRPPPPPDRPDD